MTMGIEQRLEPFLDAVLPRTCRGCGRPGRLWCRGCSSYVSSLHPQLFGPPIGAPALFAVGGQHSGVLRGAVLLFKQREVRSVTDTLVRLLAATVALVQTTLAQLGHAPSLLVVPVPTSRRRPWRIPTEELATRMADSANTVEVAPLLRTVAARVPQKGLDAAARARNVAGSFAPTAGGVPCDRSVVLFDDVVTTGATMAEANRTLREQGWPVVAATSLSHALPGG
jgi:predicted amidophosphoribosyltransferase